MLCLIAYYVVILSSIIYVINNFITIPFTRTTVVVLQHVCKLSLYKHKNSNILKVMFCVILEKMGKARVRSHAGRELFLTFVALPLLERAFGLYLIITFDRNEQHTLFFFYILKNLCRAGLSHSTGQVWPNGEYV